MNRNIADINLYNTQMSKSMKDKVFFLDKIEPKEIDTIVDFGCANGELFKYVPNSWNCIGVDNSNAMIKEAKNNFPNATYIKSLDKVASNDDCLLNMSSVIHEVYSYLSKEEIAEFWDTVWNSDYKYITIRDMMVGDVTERHIKDKDLYSVVDNANYKELHSFMERWGLTTQKDLLHFLLKYKYTENWERENNENYLPITVEELLSMIPNNYEVVYLERYTLPYIKHTVLTDFNYEIKDNTHIKLIIKRKDK